MHPYVTLHLCRKLSIVRLASLSRSSNMLNPEICTPVRWRLCA